MRALRWLLVTATAIVAATAATFAFDGRPSAWCGWYMRHLVNRDPGPEFNRAIAWTHWGYNAGRPRIGAIVVWPHHVGKIVGIHRGQWLVHSGNDGHMVKTRPRSIAGAIAFRLSAEDSFRLADVETKPVPQPRLKMKTVAMHRKINTATVWRNVPSSDRCVALGGRLQCIARARVNMREG